MAKGRTRRKWPRVLIALIVVAILVEGVLLFCVHSASKTVYPEQPADVVIVLGARVMPTGYLSTTLSNRIASGYAAYESGLAKKIIVCGAQGADEPKTEAGAMAEFLAERGVAAEDILIEDRSTDTVENLTNAKAIMDEHGYRSAIIVTSDYHMTRAMWIAKDVGLDASARPSAGPSARRDQWIGRFRETLSWINYAVRYRLLGMSA